MKKTLLLIFAAITISAKAQNVVGYWYGSASVENGGGNSYLVELILKQSSTAVQGILNYYFRNTYRSLQIKGNYNSITRELYLYNIPVPFFGGNDAMQVDCSMDLTATHRVAKAGSNLSGRFMGIGAYKYTCPPIVFDLKLNKEAGNQDSVLIALRNFKETYQLWKPSGYDTLVSATVQQRPIQNIVVDKEFKERPTDVQKEIEVSSDSLQIDFYDNGEIDGDSISVFFNEKLFGANLKLSSKSIHLNIVLDSAKEVNTLAMFANNLGSIPPNTALMLVSDGKNRFEIRLASSLEKSGAVRIKRKKKSP